MDGRTVKRRDMSVYYYCFVGTCTSVARKSETIWRDIFLAIKNFTKKKNEIKKGTH